MDTLPAAIILPALIPLAAGAAAACSTAASSARNRSRALLFHSISTDIRAGLSTVSPDVFTSLIQTLSARGIAAQTVDSILNSPSPEESLAITFDDGFADVYATALPLLARAGMTATVFVTTSFIGASSGWDLYRGRPMLSAAMIRSLAEAGWQIGSHTHTHPDLRLLSEADIRTELLQSRSILEDICGGPISSLSFPFGSWSAREWRIAKECGYASATCYRGRPLAGETILPVSGTWRFDTAEDILNRTGTNKSSGLLSRARAFIMPQFARGSGLWHFRSNYATGRPRSP